MTTPIKNRYEFVLLYDVENGNPNGDPDAGNMPRIDPETGNGIVTDVALKRKVRNYIEIVKSDAVEWKIYVKENEPLNAQHELAYKATNTPVPKNKDEAKAIRKDVQKIFELRNWMCANFYDIRTFGAVMNTDIPAGIVHGPVQINFSRSIDPIAQLEASITRLTVTRQDEDKQTEMGRKHYVPYGLYRAEGYISAKLANAVTADGNMKGTGFSEEDLELFWKALEEMFEHDHSAARGKMASRRLFVFKHKDELGNAPSHKLFDMVKVEKKDGVVIPRKFGDYTVKVDGKAPEGVELIEKL
ncbi:MAG: type I-C CRISPR-associated protein Cas7/Csd2 [Anaerolineaceae bacterium]|nr:MAG: type I-C CRISPR-associated protein Cas7/Csd2 [Anaerolineaceae bacterium]